MRIYNIGILFLFFCFSFNLAVAQKNIQVDTKSITFSVGEQTAFLVDIPEGEFNVIKKNWSKAIRQNTKSKVEQAKDELIIKGTNIISISHSLLSIYSIILPVDSAIRIAAAFEIDSTFFMFQDGKTDIQYEKQYNQIQHFLREFAVDQYKLAVNDDLEDQEKKLKNLNRELASLEKTNEGYHKNIKENEQDIQSTEDQIVSLQKDSERKQKQIDDKKVVRDEFTGDKESLLLLKDEVKLLEKDKKAIGRKIQKAEKSIVKYQGNIKEMNRLIERNLELQEVKKAEIDPQENLVHKIQRKYGAIR